MFSLAPYLLRSGSSARLLVKQLSLSPRSRASKMPPPVGLLTVADYEKAANGLLDRSARDYYNAGADDEITLRSNKEAFHDYIIRPFCLRNASRCDISTKWLGHSLEHPIGVAATAFHRMADDQGEIATVRAARRAGALMISSTWATTPLEDTRKEANGHPMWFQLYIYKDRELSTSIIRRAEAAGYSAIVLTIDTPVFGRRLIDERNRFQLPPPLKFANFAGTTKADMQNTDSSALIKYVSSQIDSSLTWEDLKHLTKLTKLPVIVKGVMREEDAVEAIKCGVKAIVVSNHGGRQLDSAPATIHILRDVVKAVDGQVPVFMDGGIRNGRDVFKAMALGAAGVFVGRPVLWGLAVAGEDGVADILRILRFEFEHTMRLAGMSSLEELRKAKNIVVHKAYFARI